MPLFPIRILARGCSAVLAAMALGACSDATSTPDARPITISFTTRASGASASLGLPAFSAVAAADSVTLTKAQLVIREIDLEPARGLGCREDEDDDDRHGAVAQDRRGSNSGSGNGDADRSGRNDDDDDDCVDVEIGPVLVDLPLTSQIQSRFQAAIPEGDYREIEVRIDKPENDDTAGREFIAQHPNFKDVSVIAEGTFKGQPFRFAARVKVKLEFEFRPALAVGPSGTNITVRVLVGRWFRDATGAPIDPTTTAAGGINAERVVRNISNSIQAFADSNRDGSES